jgi:hypothetical protein
MRPIRADLWETRVDNPYPGLTTHAYLWTGGAGGNVLFYGTQTDADFDQLEALGGVTDHYLSHRDEAGPMLGRSRTLRRAAPCARGRTVRDRPACTSTCRSRADTSTPTASR